MSYDEQIARLSNCSGFLVEAVKVLAQSWKAQNDINKRMVRVIEGILAHVAKSETSGEEIRKMVSQISKDMQTIEEGTIRTIEGFEVREQE